VINGEEIAAHPLFVLPVAERFDEKTYVFLQKAVDLASEIQKTREKEEEAA
jgi:hypothetical protein